MAERTRQRLQLIPTDRLERWSLFSGILVWVGVLVFGIGLVVTLRNQRQERVAYASLAATPTPTATPAATATPTPTPTQTPQLYPKGWSTATPTPVAPISTATPTDRTEENHAASDSENSVDGGLISPQLGLTPKPPPPPPVPPDRLVIPQIELDSSIVPVGWQAVEQEGVRTRVWEVADYAVGWHKTSSHPGQAGNLVLNGHHNIKGEVFRYLVDVKVGDQIHVDAKDERYTFAVTEKHILKEKGEPLDVRRDNAKWIEPTVDERLTIITCWPYTNNTHRLVVVAKPVPTRSIEGLVE
jgi:sortase A